MFKVALDRFARVVGGQVLGYGIAVTIAYLNGSSLEPELAGVGVVLGAGLTALDKWFRAKGIYGKNGEV